MRSAAEASYACGDRVLQVPSSPEELYGLKVRVMNASQASLDTQDELDELGSLFEELSRLRCPLTEQEAHLRWDLYMLPFRIEGRISRAKAIYKQLQLELKEALTGECAAFAERVDNALQAAGAVHVFEGLPQAHANNDAALKAQAEVRACEEASHVLNRHRELFSLPPSDHSMLHAAESALAPFVQLWQLASDWLHYHADWCVHAHGSS